MMDSGLVKGEGEGECRVKEVRDGRGGEVERGR